jgi:hypothetical protein
MIRASGSKRRKAIPDRVKLLATLREMGLKIDEVAFDHNPALELRGWDEERRDTDPPANDPEHIELMMIREAKRCSACGREVKSHREKTFGRGGEKTITTKGSDIYLIAKERRRKKANAETLDLVPPKREKPKAKIPSRPFPKRSKPKRGKP